MKHSGSIWKKYLLVAVTAFAIGMLLHFLTAQNFGGLASGLWSFVTRYAPHLISLYVLATGTLIFFEERNPDRTILWLMTLAILPVAGVILYAILGPDLRRRRNRKLFKPSGSRPFMAARVGGDDHKLASRTATLAFRNSGAMVTERGAVRVLINGIDTFTAVKERLRGASRYINMEFFIFKDDALGGEIADILCEKASSGVHVRMTTDGVGSWNLGRRLIKRLTAAGVDYHTFMPVSFPFFRSRLNFRNHRKIIVVDGDVAFTGGLNVGIEYLGDGPLGHWRDTYAMFTGEAVRSLNNVFLRDWEIAAGERRFQDDPEFAASPAARQGDMPFLPIQVVASGSPSPWRAIRQMYFAMISTAVNRIWITTPYLAPGEGIMEALSVAALSGVDVRILMPDKPDHFLAYWAGRSNIEGLLRAGVRIWRYNRGFVHAKTLLMDNLVASVGTANLDTRSLEINFEVQAFIYDADTCSTFERQFLEDLRDADECLLPDWERRGARCKFLEALGRLWSSQI
jgi:cardiolipin synthase